MEMAAACHVSVHWELEGDGIVPTSQNTGLYDQSNQVDDPNVG
jgi:hypothetical protein